MDVCWSFFVMLHLLADIGRQMRGPHVIESGYATVILLILRRPVAASPRPVAPSYGS